MGSAAENFDAYFKNRLEYFEEPPGDKAWENIAERLGHKRKRRMIAFLIRIAAGMMLIISLSVGYYYYYYSHHRSIDTQSVTSQVNESQNTEMHANNKNNNLTDAAGFDSLPVKSYKPNVYSDDNKLTGRSSEKVTAIQSFKPLKKEAFSVNNHESEQVIIYQVFSDDKLCKIRPIEAQIKEIHKDEFITVSQAKPESHLSETDLIAMQNISEMKALNEEKKQKEKWMLGGQVAPLYTYRMLSSDQLSSNEINVLNENEKGVFAYAGGICFAYVANNRLSVQTGLQYSKYGQEKVAQVKLVNTNYQYVDNGRVFTFGSNKAYQIAIDNSTGIITNSSGSDNYEYANSIVKNDPLNTSYLDFPTAVKDNYSNDTPENMPVYQYFDYLEIPLILKYKIIDSRINLSISGGVNANILVGNKVKIENENGDIYRKTADINKINYSSIAGLGFEYSLNTNLFLNFEPRFIYYINDINESVNVNVHPFSFGAFAGISYLF